MPSRRSFLAAAAAAPLLSRSRLAQAQRSQADLTDLGVREASVMMRAGRLTPTALVQAYLERINTMEGSINAYVTVLDDEAQYYAGLYERELSLGQWRGPLHGIPIAIKDNIDTAGIPTTAANGLFRDRVPQMDAPVYRRLREAGAILLGKLNMHEFAYGGTSSISHVGPVRNPWNLEHIPGGSSGGSAAAVAARLCCASLGTDTLASIRLPASYCGVTGLKPTHGLSSIRGIIPVSESLDHVGPLARSVEDTALLLKVMAGFDPNDPVSIDAPEVDYVNALEIASMGLRVGVARQPYFDDLHADVAAAMDEALEVLDLLAGQMSDVELPDPGDFTPLLAESYAWHEEYVTRRSSQMHYDASTLSRIQAAGETPVQHYIRARHELSVLRNKIDNVFREVDIVVTPTAPQLPEPLDNAIIADASGAEPSVRNTAPFNMFGIPTISIPCGFSRDGLPIGMQLSSARLREDQLFILGHAYQQVTDWHRRRPELA